MQLKVNFRLIGWAILIIAVLPGCSPTPVKLSLDGTWQFRYDPRDIGREQEWATAELAQWEATQVPAYIADESYDGIVWFATEVAVPADAGHQRLGLIFDAIDDNAIIYVNGAEAGRHYGWGERFWVELPPGIDAGATFHLVVRLEDTGGPGGIIDHVWLQSFSKNEELPVTDYSAMTAQASPAWVPEAVLYEIFVRDFSPSGDFAGVESRLDELADLGVNVLWLMPIHPIGVVQRKGRLGSPYSTRDYYGINSDFGTPEQFRNLVGAVHARGMRLILDMVPNHTAWDNDMVSDHPEWYTQNDAGDIVPPNNDWTDVADLNYENSDLRAYIQEMLLWWINQYDVDGFRIDVAEMTPADFWVETRPLLESAKSDIFLLAEGNRPYLHVSGFDATYAFSTFPVMIDVVNGRQKAAIIHETMIAESHSYPQGSIRMRFVENHDQRRAAEVTPDEPALRAITSVAFLLPGIPLIYNGAEMALKHRLELFDVDPIDWSAGSGEFREFVQQLLQLRREHRGLIEGGYEAVLTPNANVLVFMRDDILIMANLTPTAQAAKFDSPPSDLRDATRVFSSGEAAINATLDGAEFGPWGVGVFTLTKF